MIRLRDPNDPAGLSRLISRQIDAALEDGARRTAAARLSRRLGPRRSLRLAWPISTPALPPDPPAGRNLRIFEAGHAFEVLISRRLRIAGFTLQDVDPNTGRQFEFSVGGDHTRGHADG